VAEIGSGGDLKELLKLDGAAGEAVGVVDDDGVPTAVADVDQEALILGSPLAAIGRDVVVDVLVCDRPAEVRGETAAALAGGRHLGRFRPDRC